MHDHIHNCSPPCPILSQLDPVQTSTLHFLKIYLNIILPSTPGSPKWSLSHRFPHLNIVYASPVPIRATCSTHLILDFITLTILGEECRSLSSSLCSFFHYPVNSSLLGQILSSPPYSQTTSANYKQIRKIRNPCNGRVVFGTCKILVR